MSDGVSFSSNPSFDFCTATSGLCVPAKTQECAEICVVSCSCPTVVSCISLIGSFVTGTCPFTPLRRRKTTPAIAPATKMAAATPTMTARGAPCVFPGLSSPAFGSTAVSSGHGSPSQRRDIRRRFATSFPSASHAVGPLNQSAALCSRA